MSIEGKIKEYLQAGGLFNPELMDHKEVSVMIQESLKEITELKKKLDEAVEVIKFYENVKNYDACESGSVYYYLEKEQEEVGLRAREFLKGLE
jgi:hypothetical protein